MRARGDLRDVALGSIGSAGVPTLRKSLGVVSSWYNALFHDLSIHGTVPAVAVQCTEERLVDGASDKQGRIGFVSEHVEQGVTLRLDPELIA